MNKTLRIILIVLAAVLGLLLALWIALHLIPFQSNMFLPPNPWEVSEKWCCEEIDMTLHYRFDENGKFIGDSITSFTWNEIDYEVEVVYWARTISFLKGNHLPEDQIMTGEWKYVGDNMVITVGQDTIFGDELKTLTFVPID